MVIRLLILAVLLLLGGCYPSMEQSSVKTEFGSQSQSVYEVTLRDGTRCAVQIRGGIDCNWKND